ncbi:MAG TPA: hypothetical protein VGG19_11920 [Tepidisphaeraceae bacterium]
MLADDKALVDQVQHHYANLVFMGSFLVAVMVAIIWWVWKNN